MASNTSNLIVTNSLVENNAGSGLIAARSAYLRVGQDAEGSATLGPVTVRNNTGGGVVVIDASSGNVIRRSGRYGVAVLNTGSVRLGINDQGQGILSGLAATGNLIEDNVLEGLHMVGTSSAWMFGNTIRGNSTTNGRFGVLVIEQSVALHVLKGDFDITPNTNDISGNTGDGIQAIEGSLVEMRDGITVTGNSRHGILLLHGSRARLQGTTVSGNATTGISLQLGGTLRLGPAPNAITDPIVCTPGETESSVAGAPVPPGCTGF